MDLTPEEQELYNAYNHANVPEGLTEAEMAREVQLGPFDKVTEMRHALSTTDLNAESLDISISLPFTHEIHDHFWGDGNGRCARAVVNEILELLAQPKISFSTVPHADYMRAVGDALDDNPKTFEVMLYRVRDGAGDAYVRMIHGSWHQSAKGQ
ncbi:hypothetical protein niasHT_014638 [Heterodera trifolii]|uniref:Fido domain-containing protein n=1 Tax=Heterodera trifolii TaxID=157864 RepID=A0ABD2LI08_9BILA